MRSFDESISSVKSRPSVLRMAALLIVLAVFMLQLLALGVHNHAVVDDDADCPTCQLVIDTPSLPPPGDLVVTPGSIGLSYRTLLAQYRSSILFTIFLTPPSHAPPVLPI